MMARVPKRPPKVVVKGKNGNGTANGVNGNKNGTNGKNGLARNREPVPKSKKPEAIKPKPKPQPRTGRSLKQPGTRTAPIGKILEKQESGRALTEKQLAALKQHLLRVRRAQEAEERRMIAEQRKRKRILEDESISFGDKIGLEPIGRSYKLPEAVQDILEEFNHMALKPKVKRMFEKLDLEDKVAYIYKYLIRVRNVAEFLMNLENIDLAERIIKDQIRDFLLK